MRACVRLRVGCGRPAISRDKIVVPRDKNDYGQCPALLRCPPKQKIACCHLQTSPPGKGVFRRNRQTTTLKMPCTNRTKTDRFSVGDVYTSPTAPPWPPSRLTAGFPGPLRLTRRRPYATLADESLTLHGPHSNFHTPHRVRTLSSRSAALYKIGSTYD